MKRTVMEEARVFAQGKIEERRFALHLVGFPERSPAQGSLGQQGFFSCSRTCSVVCSWQMSQCCPGIS